MWQPEKVWPISQNQLYLYLSCPASMMDLIKAFKNEISVTFCKMCPFVF